MIGLTKAKVKKALKYALTALLLLASGEIEAATLQSFQTANQLPSNPVFQTPQPEEQTSNQPDPVYSNSEDKTPPPSKEKKDPFADKATGDWSGLRKQLQEDGLEFELLVMPEGFNNFCGGIRRGCVAAFTVDFKASLDMEKAFCWEGGKIFFDLQERTGSNPSTSLVGDLQSFDQFNSPPCFQIFELWYQQTFCCDTLRFKVGKINGNTDFSVVENAYYFFNNDTQVSQSILSFPDGPAPQLGADIFYSPCDCWKIGFGVFAANQHDNFGIFSGDLSVFFLTQWGAFIVGESDLFWKQDPLFLKNGNLKVGVWNHTGTFNKLAGGIQKGASGYYIVFNQTLWQPCEEAETNRGIRGFVNFGQTDKSVGIMDWTLSTGLTWTGFSKCREKDVFGFAPSYAHISSDAGLPYSYELAWEGFYCWQFTDWASLTADLQYIVHPGGFYSNALVATLNIEAHF